MSVFDYLKQALGRAISWIPDIVQAILVLVIGYFVALVVRSMVKGILRRIGLNKKFEKLPPESFFRKITDNPAKLIGDICYWIIWILFITLAIPILHVPEFNQLVYAFYHYLPNIFAAILILAIAGLISSWVDKFVVKIMGDTPSGRIVMAIVPSLIMTIAVFMVLVQLHIATSIVVITYAAILFALALGFALAFGLGGRDLASRILENSYKKGLEGAEQVRRDMRAGKDRARSGKS